ncbi:nucleotidyltransferase domain-containing protein [Gordonia sihwensis]|uniref:nucleotidyltransferase domain-containing protein n=1 Tax=Gordonia sihwensis TaxID=173559 RepID=UPI003D96F4F9
MQLNKPLATVTPTLDGSVLHVLAAADSFFTISQIQRILSTASSEGIRKVLNRLSAQGIVLHDRVGHTHTYQLNTDHLAAEPILALSRLHATFCARLEQALAAWSQDLRYAAVFGSAATGGMRRDSDIDLILVRADSATILDDVWNQSVTDLARTVTAWTGNDCHIVEYAEAEITAAAATGEPLLREIASHGLTVAGQRDWLVARLRPAQDTRP